MKNSGLGRRVAFVGAAALLAALCPAFASTHPVAGQAASAGIVIEIVAAPGSGTTAAEPILMSGGRTVGGCRTVSANGGDRNTVRRMTCPDLATGVYAASARSVGAGNQVAMFCIDDRGIRAEVDRLLIDDLESSILCVATVGPPAVQVAGDEEGRPSVDVRSASGELVSEGCTVLVSDNPPTRSCTPLPLGTYTVELVGGTPDGFRVELACSALDTTELSANQELISSIDSFEITAEHPLWGCASGGFAFAPITFGVEFDDRLDPALVSDVTDALTFELLAADGSPTGARCERNEPDEVGADLFFVSGGCVGIDDGDYELVIGGLPDALFVEGRCDELELRRPLARASCDVVVSDSDPLGPPYSIGASLVTSDGGLVVDQTLRLTVDGVPVDPTACGSGAVDFIACNGLAVGTYEVTVEGLAADEFASVRCFGLGEVAPSELVFPGAKRYDCEAVVGPASIQMVVSANLRDEVRDLISIDLIGPDGGDVLSTCEQQQGGDAYECVSLPFGTYTPGVGVPVGVPGDVSCLAPDTVGSQEPSREVALSAERPVWLCELRAAPVISVDAAWGPNVGALTPAEGVEQLELGLFDVDTDGLAAECVRIYSEAVTGGGQAASIGCGGVDEGAYEVRIIDAPRGFVYRLEFCTAFVDSLNGFGNRCDLLVSAIGGRLPDTGSNSSGLLTAASAATVVGIALVAVGRRRWCHEL